MKNRVFKLFISLLVIVAFANKVNASVVNCNPGSGDTTITETEINDAGFDATLPVCKWKRVEGEYTPMGTFNSYSEAYDSGLETEYTYVQSLDAKGLVGTNVPKCGNSDRKVTATITCGLLSTQKSCSTITKESTCNSKPNCSWNDGTCTGSTYTSYYCASGYKYNSGKCEKEDFVTSNVSAPTGCSVKYTLQCPVYKCEREYRNFSLCAPEFMVDGQPAYCVNPSQGFPDESHNYQYDDSFNVLDCSSSYSTVDCGYANILIEGAYYNTDDDAINSALRLWSIHSGQAGDQKTGVANLTGEDCKNITYFTTDENNEYVNVYKKTHDYIMDVAKAKFYDVAFQHEHIPDEESCLTQGKLDGTTFEKITCSSAKNMRGVMCGDGPSYRVAFELYFNTLIGNKCMKEHLSKLYGGGNGSKPTAATLESEYSFEEGEESSTTESWIEVSFEHESFWNEIQAEEVECSDEKLAELKQKLIKEGKTPSEAEAIINQIKPYCQITVTVIDSDGNVLVTEQDMEICIKDSGCRTTTFEFAICDITQNIEKDIEITVRYQRTKSSYSVRKYYACANANLNQTLFAFFDEDEHSDSGGDEGEEVGRDVVETSFAVTNYKCSNGCENAGPRIEGEANCKNDENNFNGVYSSSVKDPSLRCIVNLTDASAKTKYDYSEYFGVNTNFCRVYCSDEVQYVLADKVRAISGKTFMYNIEFPAKGTNELDYRLTSVVKEKRTCVSEIYYHHLSNLDTIKADYGLTNDEFKELKKSNTFVGLFNILKQKAADEGEREEVLNQLAYDIYNCNLYSKDKIKEAGISIPQNYKTTLAKKVKDVHSSSNGYGIGSDINGDKTSDNSTDVVKYEFGAPIKDTSTRVNNVKNSNKTTGEIKKIGKSSPQNGDLYKKVSYCKDKTGHLCYSYDPNDDEGSYNYPASGDVEMKTFTLFRNKNVKIPTNDYARFEVVAEINYYNNNRYQVDMGSGSVVLGNDNSDLLTLDKYSYPIDKNAYNLAACQISIEDGLYHRCSVVQKLDPLTFYRNNTATNLTINDKNEFKCYVDVEKPNCDDPTKPSCGDKNAALYRNVDPTNLFPSGNIKISSNWSTEEGLLAKESIESSAGELRTDSSYLDYSITLTPSQLKNIKKYNSQFGGYSDELIYNCNIDGKSNYYYNCNSYFLDVLRGNSSEFASGTYGDIIVDKKN